MSGIGTVSKRTFWLFLMLPAVVLLATTVTAVTVGDITHRFSGAPECLELDPPRDSILIKENVEPNDEYTIRQFITNTCDTTITVSVEINTPESSYITVESSDVGEYDLSPSERDSFLATVTFGNDTPAEFSAKDVVWKITRPE